MLKINNLLILIKKNKELKIKIWKNNLLTLIKIKRK